MPLHGFFLFPCEAPRIGGADRLAGPDFDTARAGFLAPGNREPKHAILQPGVDLRRAEIGA